MATTDLPTDPAPGFVPLTQLRRGPAPPPAFDAASVAALRGHLETFAGSLTAGERRALSALLVAGTRNPALAALAAEPPAAVLAPQEIETFERLSAAPAPAHHDLRHNLVLVMKATRLCNLRCTYCRFWSDEPNQLMTFDVLARTTWGALSAPGVDVVDFAWHGGETTLVPTSFYRKALWLQERFRRPGQTVTNSVQTNGTNLTPAWLDFLKRYRISVGVSLDGPPEVHDRRRVDIAGRPTAARAREGLQRLREHGIGHGVLMVIDDDVMALGAERLLAYLLEIGVEQAALLNVLPDNDPPAEPGGEPYFGFPRFVEFLRDLFAAWWPHHADRIAFRELCDLMRKIEGKKGQICVFDGNCMGGFLTIEPGGDVAACDKFRGDQAYQFGNVLESGLAALSTSPRLSHADAETAAGIEGTSRCRWFDVCQGGCPHDRYLRGRKAVAYDESCCGLAPLLSDIAEALRTTA